MTEFGIEPFVGIRAWGVIQDRSSPAEMSLSPVADPSHSRYTPDSWASLASWPWRRPGVHKAYDYVLRPDCSGFWALKETDPELTHITAWMGTRIVLGEVELWGRVIEATNGYRGQFAKVRSLYDAEGTSVSRSSLAHRYGVPLLELNQPLNEWLKVSVAAWRRQIGSSARSHHLTGRKQSEHR